MAKEVVFMKKFLSIFLALSLLLLTGCGIPFEYLDFEKYLNFDEFKNPGEYDYPYQNEAPVKEEKPAETENSGEHKLPLPEENIEFCFLSGFGLWHTSIYLNRDGTFTGEYYDADMGATGEGYPNGTVYTCVFSGEFGDIEKLDEFSYKMTLTSFITEKVAGNEWIEDGTLYVATNPYGLCERETGKICREYIFYLPETPISHVPEDFANWRMFVPPRDELTDVILYLYGILNVTTNDGFFTEEDK